MPRGFPVESYQQAAMAVTACHAAFLPLVVVSVFLLYWTNRRPARPRDTFWWCATFVLATWIAAYSLPRLLMGLRTHDELQSFREDALRNPVIGYTAMIWVLSGCGVIQTSFRLRRQQQQTRIVDGLILMAIFLALLPALFPTSSGVSSRLYCHHHFGRIGAAFRASHESTGAFLPAVTGTPEVSWRVSIIRYADNDSHTKLFEMYQSTEPWDSSANLVVASSRSDYECRSNPHSQDGLFRRYTAFAMVTGPGTNGGAIAGVPQGEDMDGRSNTIAVVEAVGQQIVWTEPRDVDVSKQPIGINLLGSKPAESPGVLSSYHLKGAHAMMADGRVRFLSESTDPELLRKLLTVADEGDEETVR